MKNTIYAIVYKDSNRAISIVESDMVDFIDNGVLQHFDLFEVGSIGTSTRMTEFGTINSTIVFENGKVHSRDVYHIITQYPEEISLDHAYSLLK